MLSIADAKKNLNDTIAKYKRGDTSLTPNDPKRDKALLLALQTAQTWRQVGVIATHLSERFSLLQKPIDKIEGDDYRKAINMRFDEGTSGWYSAWGTSADGRRAYVLNIVRVPTTGSCTAANTFYNVVGYVLDNGVKHPFTVLGMPLFCPGTFISTTDPDKLSLVMNLTDSSIAKDPSVFLKEASIVGDASSLRDMKIKLAFKDGSSYAFDLSSMYGGALQAQHGCMPCVGGAGSNYWSFTRQLGTGTGFHGKAVMPNFGARNGSSTEAVVVAPPTPGAGREFVGWFDHQWMNPTPHVFIDKILDDFVSTVTVTPELSCIWIALQPSDLMQYMVVVKFDGPTAVRKIKPGAVFSAYVNRFSGGFPSYNIPHCKIKILTVMPEDRALPLQIRVSIGTDEAYIITPTADGRVTTSNGSINFRSPALLLNTATNMQSGTAFLMEDNLHNQVEGAKNMMLLGGIRGAPIQTFLPHKRSPASTAASIAFVVCMAVLALAIVIGIVYGIILGISRARGSSSSTHIQQAAHSVHQKRSSRRRR